MNVAVRAAEPFANGEASALPVQFASADGTRLCGHLFTPPGSVRAAVLVAGAMGVEASYYQPFARWLAEQGVATFTFDYRGMGRSRTTPSLRGVQADLYLWTQDEDAALLALAERFPRAPLLLVGNSLGAQLAANLPSRDRLQGLVAVSMGSGAVRHLVPAFRNQARLFLHVVAPVATALVGYFPGARLGSVGDLPRGVMAHWRRWCLSPEYLLSAEGWHARYREAAIPLISLYMADDELLAEDGARLMFDAHGQRRHFEVLQPPAGQRLGHLGVFKSRCAATHWPLLLNHLKSLTP